MKENFEVLPQFVLISKVKTRPNINPYIIGSIGKTDDVVFMFRTKRPPVPSGAGEPCMSIASNDQTSGMTLEVKHFWTSNIKMKEMAILMILTID